MTHSRLRTGLLGIAFASFVLACATTQSPRAVDLHGWWQGLGPVVPHDSFPTDCGLCHVGGDWIELREDFTFDHALETGVPLEGAHDQAQCLLCHNDRGHVSVFTERGCMGCHEDVHVGTLGTSCETCHVEDNWFPVGQIERHSKTRFPLVGAHAATSCYACHPGAQVGRFLPQDTACVSCHVGDLEQAINPPHVLLGWVDTCNRCHMPTTWQQAEPE